MERLKSAGITVLERAGMVMRILSPVDAAALLGIKGIVEVWPDGLDADSSYAEVLELVSERKKEVV